MGVRKKLYLGKPLWFFILKKEATLPWGPLKSLVCSSLDHTTPENVYKVEANASNVTIQRILS